MRTEDKVIVIPDYMFTLMAINDNPGISINGIHYQMRITYSHLHLIKKVMVDREWITIEKHGNMHIPHLTKAGKRILDSILVLIENLGYTKEDVYKLKLKDKKSVGFDDGSKQTRVSTKIRNEEKNVVEGDADTITSEDEN